jgi:hypothetical protein
MTATSGQIILRLVFWTWLASLAGQPLAAEPKGQSMRINLDWFSFEAPPGFVDATGHTFNDKDKRELLTVDAGDRPSGATNLASLLSLRRKNLEFAMAGGVTVEAEAEARVGELPGRMLAFRFEDKKVRYRERWAVALTVPDSYLQISHAALASDPEAAGRFQHILASVVLAGRPEESAPAPGYVRRWAGGLTLDVPKNLFPPRVWQFVSADGPKQVVVSAFDPRDTKRPIPTEAEERAQDGARGTMEEAAPAMAVSRPQASGLIKVFTLTPTEGGIPARQSIRRAYLSLPGGILVHVFARAPMASGPALESLVANLVGSIQTPN